MLLAGRGFENDTVADYLLALSALTTTIRELVLREDESIVDGRDQESNR